MKRKNYLAKVISIAATAYIVGSSPFAYASSEEKSSNLIGTESELELQLSEKNLEELRRNNLTKKILRGVGDVIKFAAGYATGLIVTHEGSHYIAAKSFDIEPGYDIKNPDIVSYKNYGKANKKQKIITSGAGLMGQTLTAEAILNYNLDLRKNPYLSGILTHSIVGNMSYAINPDFDKRTSDIKQLEDNGINTKVVRKTLVLHSLYTAYRALNNSRIERDVDFFVTSENDGKISAGINSKFSSSELYRKTSKSLD
jgi:hypothetical protein